MSSPFESADEDQLREIIREAEAYLQAQLTSGIAADQRAMVYAGFLAAAIIALAGGAASAFRIDELRAFTWVAIVVAGGFMRALHLATTAARPVEFCYVGNRPEKWEMDLRANRELRLSLADMARHYDGMIAANARVLSANCDLLSRSMRATSLALYIGFAIAGSVIAYRMLKP